MIKASKINEVAENNNAGVSMLSVIKKSDLLSFRYEVREIKWINDCIFNANNIEVI